MIAYGLLKPKSAFKMMCKAKGDIPVDLQNLMSEAIDKYEKDLKHADDEDRDDILLENYMENDELYDLYKKGEDYFGIVSDCKVHPCFEKDTLIKTNFGLKPIQDIAPGDMVLTHKNRFKKVVELMKNKSDGVGLGLTIGGHKIKTTDNHPFYIKRGNDLMWIAAKDIRIGDFAVSIKNTKSKPLCHTYEKSKTERKKFFLHDFKYNKDFMWVLGRILGDGCSPNMKGINRTQLDFGYQDWNEDMEAKIKRATPFKWRFYNNRTTKRAICETKELSELVKTFGNLAHNKEIPQEILDMPKDMLLEFFYGYASADGHLGKNGQVAASTVSKKLAISLKEMAIKLFGTPSSLRISREAKEMTIEGRKVFAKRRFDIKIRPDKDIVLKKYSEDDIYFYSEVEKIEQVDLDIDVFNLSVEDDNSYVADGFVVHNCGYVIANTNLIDIFGVVVSPKGDICLNLEGKYADELGYLKLDWLTVSVVDLTDKVYKEIGIPQPTAPELYELVEGDSGTWEIYENGFVQCVNQVEKSKTRDKCMRYSPRSVEDLCAFIASIRPGFMSYYKRFESREDFRFGVEGLDNLLRGKFLDGSWCLYQEQVMKILKWIGFDSKDTYSTLKGIGKKKLDVIMKVEEKFANEGVAKLIEEGASLELAKKAIHDLWTVIMASANYSFNSSHSYSMAHDSLWIAYAKAHYPLQTYKTCIEFHSQRKEKDKVAKLKKEAEHFGIKLQPMKFGQDNRGVTYSAEKREIYQNLMSVKNINGNVAEIVYVLRDQKCDWFDFMLILKSNGLDVSQIEALIKIGYFSEFGHAKKLLWLVENFKTYTAPSKDAILKLYEKIGNMIGMTEDEFMMQVMSMADKVTAKQFRFEDELKLIKHVYNIIEIEEVSNLEQLYWEVEYLGSPDMEIPESVIVGKVERLSYNQKFKRTSMLVSDLSSGLETWVSQSIALPVQEKNIVYLSGIKETVAKNGKIYKSCSNTLCLDVLFKKPKKEGKK